MLAGLAADALVRFHRAYKSLEERQGPPCGGAEIDFSGGYRLTLFPDGSVGEDWRLFRPTDKIDAHFVVAGGRIEGAE